MREKILKIYLRTPSIVKRILFNLEAIRRNKYRRKKGYSQKSTNLSFRALMNVDDVLTYEKLNDLIMHANSHVGFFKGSFENITVNKYKDLEKLPTLKKENIKRNKDNFLSEEIDSKDVWDGSTSGSTGSPLKYYKDPESVMMNQILYDKYYEFLGCNIGKKRIRLSGIKVLPVDNLRPPYWIYIDIYKQLQCSVYHIGPTTFQYYVDKFGKFDAEFGTGLPSAWATLARLMNEKKVVVGGMKAIVTDSEELKDDDRNQIEKAFQCPVFSTYGLGEAGMFAVECKNHNYHIIPYSHIAEVVDDSGKQVSNGKMGEIIVTDLYSKKAPFIRYRTGDLGVFGEDECGCGLNTKYFKEIIGRIEDYILTKDGRKFSRVSLIVKRAKNIKASQIIQISINEVLIKVIPDELFDPSDMNDVLDDARAFLGDISISWEAVEQLERMPSGKVKFLIRREVI